MAKATNLRLFIGTDFSYSFAILSSDEVTAEDVSTWAISWMLKTDSNVADASASLTKTTSSGITITGTFNTVPATNTQRVVVAIDDTDTTSLIAGGYVWELKRTDAGSETVLAYGNLTLIRSVHQ
jgi:hypothetical protein